MSDYATNSKLGQFKTHEGDYSIEEEIFKIIGGTLKEKEQELRDTIDNQKEEIDRLNNIINELEKWLRKNINDINAYFENTPFGIEDTYKEVLDKLKELKENNK